MNELMVVRQVACELGLELKIPKEVIDGIRDKSPKKQLIFVVGEIVRQETKPAWRAIVEALQSQQVQRPKMAEEIFRKYCTIMDGEN